MRIASIAFCAGTLAGCAQAPLLPEYAPLQRLRMVQVRSATESAESDGVWRRCADCPAVTEKTRMEQADARTATASHIGTMKEAAALPSRPRVQGLPRTELHFAFESVTLSLAEQETLRSWVASWGPNPAAQLHITAYAENSRASRDLSDVRGREVQVALWRLGIPFTQFERTVEVVNDPAGRIAIEVTRIPSGEAPAAPRVVPTPEDAGTRPASPNQARAHSFLHHGALP